MQNFDNFQPESIKSIRRKGDTKKMMFPDFTWDRRPTPSDKRTNVFTPTFFDEENVENNPNTIGK